MRVEEELVAAFPGLQGAAFTVTSPPDESYNCIAWAASRSDGWWWPEAGGRNFWPEGAPHEDALTAFEAAYATLGFVACRDAAPEDGFVKIALYADSGILTHVARQLPNGNWTSKLGESVDIEHPLGAIEGRLYGKVWSFMRRPTSGMAE